MCTNKHFSCLQFSFLYCRVCRRWNALTKSRDLWKKVDVELYEPCGSQNKAARKLVAKLPSCVTHIKLDFRHRSDWTELLNFKELCVRLKRCPNLQMLHLRASKLSDNLQSVIDFCTQFLKELKILVFHYSVFPHCLVGKKQRQKFEVISKIEILDLNSCELGPFNKPPFSRMPHLRKLFLGLAHVNDSWFQDVTFHCNPLEVLDLGTWIGSKSFQTIQHYILHLKELYLCISYVVNDDFAFTRARFPNLEKICLNGCRRVTCWGIIFFVQSCPFLQYISVDRNVVRACATNLYFLKNKCKLELVKFFDCYSHRKVDYLCG